MNSHHIALLAVIISAVLGSAVAGITKKGLLEIPPYSFVFLRFLIASLCVLPFLFSKKNSQVFNLKELTPISLFATINVIFFIFGVNLTTANIGSVMYAAIPLLTAIIIYLCFKNRLSKLKEIGIFIGFLGVLFITLLPILEVGNPFAGNLLGNIFLTIAIIFWSLYLVFSKKLLKKYSPLVITYHYILLTTIVTFPLFIWDLYNNFGWWEHVTGWGIFSLGYVAIIVTIFNSILNQYAIRHGGAIMASMMFYIIPVLAVGINFLLLGELLTPGFIFGGILAIFGTYLVVKK